MNIKTVSKVLILMLLINTLIPMGLSEDSILDALPEELSAVEFVDEAVDDGPVVTDPEESIEQAIEGTADEDPEAVETEETEDANVEPEDETEDILIIAENTFGKINGENAEVIDSVTGETLRIGVSIVYIRNTDTESDTASIRFVYEDELREGLVACGCVTILNEEEMRVLYSSMQELAERLEYGAVAYEVLTESETEKAMAVTPATGTIGVGESIVLKVERGSETGDGPIECTFDKKYLAASKGIEPDTIIVKGKKTTSSTTITVKIGEETFAVKISVKKAPGKCTIQTSKSTLVTGETAETSVKLSSGSYSHIQYTSSDTNVATIDENGLITAVGRGTCTITAHTYKSSVKGSVKIKVYDQPAKVEFANASTQIVTGTSMKAQALLKDSSGYDTIGEVRYSSSDESIFTVDENTGIIKAVAAGSATLIAETENGVRGEQTVFVFRIEGADSVKIGKGDYIDLFTAGVVRAYGLPQGEVLRYKATTSNKKVATVDATGRVKGVKDGSAKITITTESGAKLSVKVIVAKAPTSMKLGTTSLNMTVGTDKQITVSFNKGAYAQYTCESSDPSIVSVEPDGTLHALNSGSVKVSFRTLYGKLSTKSAVCSVHVYEQPDSVWFTQEKYTLFAGQTQQAGIVFPFNTYADTDFVSMDTGKLAISEDGTLKANANAGGNTVEIRCKTAFTGVEARASVEIIKAPARVVFENGLSKITIGKGDVLSLPKAIVYNADGVEAECALSYKSSSSKNVSVNTEGKIKGIKAGSATITATTFNGKKATLKVTVSKNKVDGLVLAENEHTMFIDPSGEYKPENYQIEARGMIGSTLVYTGISYSSSNTAVAVVNDSGVVTPIGAGRAVITCRTSSGSTATCEINILKASKHVEFEYSPVMGVGMKQELTPIFDAGSTSILEYESLNPGRLTVKQDGTVEAIAAGEATIRVKGTYGLTKELQFTVLQAPSGITIPGNELYIKIGDTFEFNPVVTPSNSATYTEISVSGFDADIIRVQGTRVTGLKVGTTEITFSTCNGRSVSCEIHVLSRTAVTDGFTIHSASMLTGTEVDLSEYIAKGPALYGKDDYEIRVENSSVLSQSGSRITANASSGHTTVSLIADSTVLDTMTIYCIQAAEINITADGQPVTSSGITLKTAKCGDREAFSKDLRIGFKPVEGSLPQTVLGAPEIRIENSDSGIIQVVSVYDPDINGYRATVAAGNQIGNAILAFSCGTATATVKVTVEGIRYRALLVGEFNNSKETSANLPFIQLNINNMEKTLGADYDITKLPNNPQKDVIHDAITSTFMDAMPGDVSLIYIVAHGHSDSGRYYFSIPTSSSSSTRQKVYANELLQWISGIDSQVVLVIDSCYSGYFLDNSLRDLERLSNISVITAQSSWPASWAKKGSLIIEFFTSVMARGLQSSTYDAQLKSLPKSADADQNGLITVSELFDYTQKGTTASVDYYMKQFLAGGYFYMGGTNNSKKLAEQIMQGWTQVPCYYIPGEMVNTVIMS